MEIKFMNVADIRPYDKNAKKHPADQVEHIANSIREFGFRQPLVVDKDNVLVIGHGRLLASKKLKLEVVPVVCADDLTDEQIKALRLADNKTNESDWDLDLLNMELDDITDIDMTDFGFDILDSPSDPVEIVEDEIPEEAEERSKLGDLWKLGGCYLICGDSTDEAVIARLMQGQKADLLLTDPPYNVDYVGKTKDALKIQNDKMEDGSFRLFLHDAFQSANSVMRPGAVFYIWHADSEGYNFRGACHDVDWKVRECLVWNKNSMVLGRQDYQWKHEPCLYGWKDGASHLWASDRKQTTVLDFDRPTKSELHPTMKPVGLFAYQIGNNTHEGDAVLDLFGGSGTTLIACEQLKRRAYLCELDPHYCDVILQRWENLTGKKAELVE